MACRGEETTRVSCYERWHRDGDSDVRVRREWVRIRCLIRIPILPCRRFFTGTAFSPEIKFSSIIRRGEEGEKNMQSVRIAAGPIVSHPDWLWLLEINQCKWNFNFQHNWSSFLSPRLFSHFSPLSSSSLSILLFHPSQPFDFKLQSWISHFPLLILFLFLYFGYHYSKTRLSTPLLGMKESTTRFPTIHPASLPPIFDQPNDHSWMPRL